VPSKLIGFMDDMNSHLFNIASALYATQQHKQALMNREMTLEDQKIGLFKEAMNISDITKDETIDVVKKLAHDSSLLSIFYQCSEEWKKDFIINLIHLNESSSFMN